MAQTLATEAVTSEYAHANDGLPHTLEHMIFLGSELYPYKGVLDQLANRCLAGVSCASPWWRFSRDPRTDWLPSAWRVLATGNQRVDRRTRLWRVSVSALPRVALLTCDVPPPPPQTDHTAYTLTTAGSDGFLNLMPIYIDHILYPTLSTASE